jgi:2-dehydro-3-deoxyglucarate aldolase/4-hydroxy-2-oxoheptanedioate aldolase
MYPNRVKKALAEGRLQLGTSFAQIPSPDVARILAAAGFDWAFIDTEHGWFGLETVKEVCYASVRAGLCPIVRVVNMDYGLVARALDCGAQGVMFPRVESVELLERAVSWTKFPPAGIRGCGLNIAHIDFAKTTIPEVVEHANANTMVVLQIETRRALEMRDELLSVRGIDAVMVGPVDLSISLGVPGEFQHPKMVTAMEQIRDACIHHGIAPGTQTRTLPLAKFWREREMKFLGCSSEVAMLLERGNEITSALRAESAGA